MTSTTAPATYFQTHGHAVVIGASLGGLLAARVLASHFKRVTIFERDVLPDRPDPRKGVPQGRHVHVLMIRGQQLMSEWFPGLVPRLTRNGAVAFNTGNDLRWHHFGCWKKRFKSAFTALSTSRPHLEHEIRERVRALPNVALIDGTVVTRYLVDWEGARLTGVCVRDRNASLPEDLIDADLVVDASGRGSQTPQRLKELGYEPPEETLVKVDYAYATRLYERPAHCAEWKSLIVASRPPAKRGGLIFPIEGNRWMVTLVGCHGDTPPTDEAGFLEFARGLPTSDVHAALTKARPLGEIVPHGFPGSQRRFYERLRRYPIGLMVLGDALCSFNPVYGQGMTVGAIEAKVLEDCLNDLRARGTPNLDALTFNFRERVAKAVEQPWQVATGEDLRFPETSGTRGARVRFIHWYTAKIHEAASLSAVVAERFYQVSHMLSPPSALFSLDVVKELVRVAWHGAQLPAEHSVQTRRSSALTNTRPV